MEKEIKRIPLDIQLFADDDAEKDKIDPIPDPAPDQLPPVDQLPEPDPVPSGDVIPTFETIEDYNRVLQSTASKAKGDILKEIGYASVAEIKDAIAKGQNVQQIVDELSYAKEELQFLRNEKKRAEDELLLTTVGVAPEFAEPFLKLVDADDSGRPRSEVALDLKNAFLTGKLFTDITPGVKIGGGKTDSVPSDEAISKVRAAAGLKD